MPETMTLNSTAITTNNDTFTDLISVTGASIERTTPSIPAAKVGQLTTRTDADTGVITMVAGHGFATSDKLDVFWDGGSRRNMTATVATNAVTVDGGSGDNLPANLTAVTVMKQVVVDFDVDGDTVRGFGCMSNKYGWVVFVDDADAEIAAATFRITTAGQGKVWATGSPGDNPLAGSIVSKVKFTHSGSDAAYVMKACAVFGTPP